MFYTKCEWQDVDPVQLTLRDAIVPRRPVRPKLSADIKYNDSRRAYPCEPGPPPTKIYWWRSCLESLLLRQRKVSKATPVECCTLSFAGFCSKILIVASFSARFVRTSHWLHIHFKWLMSRFIAAWRPSLLGVNTSLVALGASSDKHACWWGEDQGDGPCTVAMVCSGDAASYETDSRSTSTPSSSTFSVFRENVRCSTSS